MRQSSDCDKEAVKSAKDNVNLIVSQDFCSMTQIKTPQTPFKVSTMGRFGVHIAKAEVYFSSFTRHGFNMPVLPPEPQT